MPTKTAFLLLLALAIALPAYWGFAGENDAKSIASQAGGADDPEANATSEESVAVSDESAASQRYDFGDALGKTIKLCFKLQDDDGGGRPLLVLVATENYEIKIDVSEADGDHAVYLAGQLRLVDAEHRILLTYDARVDHSNLNEDFSATFTTRGSAIVTYKKETTLALLGGETLLVTATLEE